MVEHIAYQQNSRKRILTRADLLGELEKVLLDLMSRPQFAGLRLHSLDSFCTTDNPFLRQLTLGDLATSPYEALRDTSQVERKEIAALVEALHVVNVSSDGSLNALYDSFASIERKADSVQQALRAFSTLIPQGESHEASPDDANIAKLRGVLRDLRKKEHFDQIKDLTIEQFWDQRAPACSKLAGMTWLQLIETPPTSIFNLPHLGKSRFTQLLKAIERASQNSKSEVADTQTGNPVREAEELLREKMDWLKAHHSLGARTFVEALERCNQQALLTIFLAQSTQQRRIGQMFQLTESRISQLLKSAQREIAEHFQSLDANLCLKIEQLLSNAACAEDHVLSCLGLENPDEHILRLVRVLLVSLGGRSPQFRSRTIDKHWTTSTSDLDETLKPVLEATPQSTAQLNEQVKGLLPNSNPTYVLRVLPPNLFYLRTKDRWYSDQEQALLEILRQAQGPLTAQEITSIFETGPRQMRYLLQNSKAIVRIGKNNGRRYALAQPQQ